MEVTGASIQQIEKDKPKSRCRKWRLWASTADGRKSRRFSGTWTQAQDALAAFVRELEDKVPCADSFESYALSWAEWRDQSGAVSANGAKKDARNVAALRRTKLAGMRMDEITPDACRDALLWLKSHPKNGKGELANATVAGFHCTLHAIMAQALADGRVARNPMDGIKPPKIPLTDREALSPEELSLLLNRIDTLPTDGRTVAIYLMACLGLRRGEALALLDADVSEGMAHVHLAVKEANGKLDEPKSPSGVRILPVPRRLQDKIDEWRALRRQRGLSDAPTLCCSAVGTVMAPQNLYKWWREVSPSLGCEGMVMHELRHSNLSMMARHMSPFDLQRYAGWSSLAPARIYIHDDLDAVSKAVSDAWNGLECTKNAPDGLLEQNTSL